MASRHGEGALRYDKARGRWTGAYEASVGPDGKRHRKRVYAATKGERGPGKKEVLAQLRQLADQREAGTLTLGAAMTTGQWLDYWVDEWLVAERDAGHIKPRTFGFYRQVVKDWVRPYVGDVELANLEAGHVEDMMTTLGARGLSATSQAHARRALRRALRIAQRGTPAVHRGKPLVMRNAAALAQAPNGADQPKLDPLSPEDVAKVLKAAEGDRWEALAVLVLVLGLRQSEVIDLRWADVDFAARDVQGGPGQDAGRRPGGAVTGWGGQGAARPPGPPPGRRTPVRRHMGHRVRPGFHQ